MPTSVFLATRPFGPDAATAARITYLGDSLVKNVWRTWPDSLATAYPPFQGTPYTVNAGISGARVSALVPLYVASPHANRPPAGAPGWFLLHGGGNDLADGVAPATVYGYLASLWASARADGYTVVALTLCPRASGWNPSGSQGVADALNALIVGDGSRYDYLVRADQALPNPLNTLWYRDTTHPTDLGAELIAQAVAAVLP